jgi:hypothetical protein
MRKLLCSPTLLLCFCTFVFAEDADPASVVKRLESNLAKACVAGDVAVYDAALSERFRGVNADGTAEAKNQYLSDLREGTFSAQYKLNKEECQSVGEVVIYHQPFRKGDVGMIVVATISSPISGQGTRRVAVYSFPVDRGCEAAANSGAPVMLGGVTGWGRD